MRYCINCRREIPDNSPTDFCDFCRSAFNQENPYYYQQQGYQHYYQQPPYQQQYYQQPPHQQYQQPYQQPYSYNQPQSTYDEPSIGYAVLSFFIPIVGLILYLMWKDSTPLKAKSCIKGTLASVIASTIGAVVIYIISIFLTVMFGIYGIY